MRLQVRQWLTKPGDWHGKYNNGFPVPMRVMYGEIIRSTGGMVYVRLYGKPEPSTKCLHCGRTLTHPVSLMYGIGPVCGGHFHISPVGEDELDEYMDTIRAKLRAVTWEGWVPRKHVTIEMEKQWTVEYIHEGRLYQTVTKDASKLDRIRLHCKHVRITEALV